MLQNPPPLTTLRSWQAFVGEERVSDPQLAQISPNKRRAKRHPRSWTRTSQNGLSGAGRFTVAGIAFYAYTHVTQDGVFALRHYPAVTAWQARVAKQPNTSDVTLA